MTISDTYFSDPDWLPNTNESGHFGDNELYIDFVGGPYRILGLNDRQMEQLKGHFAEACIPKPKLVDEVINIYIYRAAVEHFQLPAPPPKVVTFELDPQKDHVRIAGENMCAVISLSDNITGHLWTIDDLDYFHSNTFDNFFRMLVTYRLMENGGMLLHSAGVVNRDSAFLFPGRSNDGKSTLSRLSLKEGRTVLSDDMNAVTWHDGQPFVEKVPFTGDLKRTWTRSPSYPLQSIFAIKKATVSSVEEISLARTLTLLTSCTPYLNADSHRMQKLLENLYHLTQKVPTHILNFSLCGDIWNTIEASLKDE